MIEKHNIKDAVELILEKDYIIIKPKTVPGKGWEKWLKKMHENGKDQLLGANVFENENFE